MPTGPGPARPLRRAVRRLHAFAERLGRRIDRRAGLADDTAEAGQATVEFVIIFPVFVLLFLAAFEASLLLTRQLMLERALDVVVRDVRLSTGTSYRQDQLRTEICERARILPDCNSNMVVEMTLVDRTTYAMPNTAAQCIERTATAQAFDIDNLVTNGGANDLMLIRACYVIDPVFPGAGLGLELTRNLGEIQMVAASAFVQEP